jgi:hypothetical protein
MVVDVHLPILPSPVALVEVLQVEFITLSGTLHTIPFSLDGREGFERKGKKISNGEEEYLCLCEWGEERSE